MKATVRVVLTLLVACGHGVQSKYLEEIEFDSGPHTLTRTRLRARPVRDKSLRILRLMKERGALAALTESKTSP